MIEIYQSKFLKIRIINMCPATCAKSGVNAESWHEILKVFVYFIPLLHPNDHLFDKRHNS